MSYNLQKGENLEKRIFYLNSKNFNIFTYSNHNEKVVDS